LALAAPLPVGITASGELLDLTPNPSPAPRRGEGQLEHVQDVIRVLLAKDALPWEHQREQEVRKYDLRAQVRDLWLESVEGERVVGMLLQCDQAGSGRPEQVIATMGLLAPPAVHRWALVLAEPPTAMPARDRKAPLRPLERRRLGALR